MRGVAHGLAVVALLLSLAGVVRAAVTVQAVVDQEEVYVGQSFTLQVQVEGSDSPGEPDISSLIDFTVEPRGGQQNSSESVSIINGRMSRVSHRGYVFNYELTSKREGRLVIPPLSVIIDKQLYQTQPVRIVVKQPEESDEFKLRQTLSKDRVYVGEPVTLTVTWYIGKDVKGFNFTLPIFSDPRFTISADDRASLTPGQDNSVRIPVPGGEIVAEKGQGVLNGEKYLTVTFSRIVTVNETGKISLPQITVSCQALSGYRQGSGRDPFSGMFPDDFFGRSRQVYRTEVVPSDQPVVEVFPLPEEGRPVDFTGLVGEYSVAVTATPTKVKIGDPITLNIQIAGPSVAGASLPSLAEGLGVNDFKVPDEMAPGEGSAVLKTFTQTIRARHAGVRQIPSLHLAYFNPDTGRYETASSPPVLLEVSEARLVTAQDAEGGMPSGPEKKELTTVKGGISYNYEGPEVLTIQAPIGSVGMDFGWYVLLGAPPGVFLLVLVGAGVVRLGRKDPVGRAARRAYGRLRTELDPLADGSETVAGYQAIGLAMREYLGAKLRRNPAALTYVDVEPDLIHAGVGPELLGRLRQVMEQCEASQYAGALSLGDVKRLRDLAVQVADDLESLLVKGVGR
ncbi:MAG: BatD family protein [Proteobacteria bacterium]|nr:BatD family protein [Pseudomonadota bacterium]